MTKRQTCFGNWEGNCLSWKTDRHGCHREDGHRGDHVCRCGARLKAKTKASLHGVGSN